MKKRKYSKIILKENLKIDEKKEKQNRQQKKKEKEVCLFFPNFKLVSNQTKIQKFLKIISLQNILEKL